MCCHRLEIGDKVGIKSGTYKGHIAIMLKTRNVPGLEKVLFKLDNWPDGCEMKIDRSACFLIDKLDDYKDFAYDYPKKHESPIVPEPVKKKEDKTKEDKKKSSRDEKRDRKSSKHRDDDRDRDRKRRRRDGDDDDERDLHRRDKRRRRDEDENSSSSKKRSSSDRRRDDDEHKKPHESWLMNSIRVRIVRERWEKYHLKKAVIYDVPQIGIADVRLEDGKRLDGVKEAYMQTALPKAGGQVLVLRGEHRGSKGKLLQRNKKTEKAVVQLYDDSEIVTVSMEDVAEFCG